MAVPTALPPRNAEPPAAYRPQRTNHAGAARHARPAARPPGRPQIGDQQAAALVRAAADGDEAAWRTLLARYNGLVWWVVRGFRFDEEQAADMVQLTWTKLVEHIGRIRDPERLGGWLVQTASRLCTQARRRAAREQRLRDDLRDPLTEESADLSTLRRDQLTTLNRAMARLSDRDRVLLSYLILHPVSYAQISRILNMPPGSIGPTRARVLHRLRAELAELEVLDARLG